jgi:formylglycine-generating enzyme required for sulfatase activity
MRQVLAGMDFKYFVRLQKQIMEAYRPTVEAGSPPALAEGEVYVPGGYFLMGNEEAGIDDNTFPYRIVWVSPFAMDKFEVSNAQYRKFLEHVQKTGDSSMEHPDAPPLKDHTPEGWKSDELKGDDQPVLGVDWFDAYAYAKWAGKRLPTEAEWEKAARGADGRKYIWGNDPILQRIENFPAGRDYVVSEVNRQRPPPPAPKKEGLFDKPEEVQAQPPFALPVATWPVAGRLPPGAPESNFPDLTNAPSVYGLYHLAGNAAEWVDDYYYAGAYQSDCWRDPPCVTTGSAHSVRGASYLGPSDGLPVFARLFDPSDHFKNGLDASGKPMAGIRCARSLTEPTR